MIVDGLQGTVLESRAKRVAEESDMILQSDPSI